MKTKQRIKSPEETAQETEFYRRRNLPHCDARMIVTNDRMFDVFLTVCGIDIGHKTEISKRGKVVQVHYLLPSLEPLERYFALPVAK